MASRNIGVGYQGLIRFCGALNMPFPMRQKAYQDHVMAVRDACEEAANESMQNAVNEVKGFYEEEQDNLHRIGVSGDGTWRIRGYKSLYGVVSILSITNGKVLDTEVMSKECRECMQWEGKEHSDSFNDWWESHQHACAANFSGSSGAMDSEGCLAIFKRSEEKHGLIYSEFLGDGDSKAYNRIVTERVYGEQNVSKLECVGHVQKRMGSRLRELKRRLTGTKLHDGKAISGKGRLTDKLIDSLQVYYGQAIRQYTQSVERMRDAVMAIWHHSRSTDDTLDHDLCPKGKDSWCGFQRDVATGQKSYKHDHSIPDAICQQILPIFKALSSDALLQACVHGGTQNQNEALNALIWQRAPCGDSNIFSNLSF